MKAKRVLAVLLSAVLAFTVIPAAPREAIAASEPAISLGAEGLAKNGSVVFGTYLDAGEEIPLMWRVLGKGTVSGTKLLITEQLLEETEYVRSVLNGVSWQGSIAQRWCEKLYESFTTPQEKKAVAATTKKDAEYTGGGETAYFEELKGDHYFFLSLEEAMNYFDSDDDRISWTIEGETRDWWLRSVGEANGVDAPLFITEYGYPTGMDSDTPSHARPAFNLKTSQVLFTSALNDGKESGKVGVNALKKVGTSTGTRKLTLLDDSRKFAAKPTDTTVLSRKTNYSVWTVELNYSGASTGSGEYVSAMLTSSSGKVLYYGHLAAVKTSSAKSGKVSVRIPKGLAAGTYKLQLFNERLSEEAAPDIASKFSTVTLKISDSVKYFTAAKVTVASPQQYTGKAVTPEPVVKFQGKTLKKGTDYTVTYSNNVKIGTATVTVSGRGNYSGSRSATFRISDLVKDFVSRLYRICLDREPETAGLTWWVDRLKKKIETGGSCAWGFFDSTEFKNHKYSDSAFLDRAYKAFFNRSPDTAGKNYWLNEMKKGMSRKDVITKGFALSNEWKALCKKYGIKP